MGRGTGTASRLHSTGTGGSSRQADDPYALPVPADGTRGWAERVAREPGQLHALAVDGGLLLDDHVYADRSRLSEFEERTCAHLSNEHWLLEAEYWQRPWAIPSDPRERREWERAARDVFGHPIMLEGEELTAADVRAHLTAHAPAWASLADDQGALDALTGSLRMHVERVDTERIWHATDEWTDRVHAEVGQSDDEEVVERLLAAGARWEDHDVQLPLYTSAREVLGGQALVLDDGDAVVRYVPHGLGRYVDVPEVVVTETLRVTDEQVARWHADLDAEYAAHVHDRADLAVIRRERDGRVRYDIVTPDRKEHAQVLSREGQHGRNAQGVDIRFMRGDAEEIPADLLVGVDRHDPSTGGGVMLASTHEQWQGRKRVAAGWKERELSFSWVHADRDDAEDANHEERLITLEAACEARNLWAGPREMAVTGALDASLVREEATATTTRWAPANPAPRSERGRLWVEGVGPDDGLAAVQAVGLAGRARGMTGRGRVTPVHPDFHDAPIEVPAGRMLVHGITASGDADAVAENVERILASGGLKSAAERRRAVPVSGNSADRPHTMSERGDVNCGIDDGVACSLTDSPLYGQGVFFAMRPEVLGRRDLWFAPRDFGAKEGRERDYRRYAQAIGAGRDFRDAPSAAARRTHYERGGATMVDNEVYVRHQITPEDIDTVWVAATPGNDGAYRRISGWVAQQQRRGRLPGSLRVAPYTGDERARDDLTTRIRRRASEVNAAAGVREIAVAPMATSTR